MSVAKYLLAYTLCAVALVVYQTGVVSAADTLMCYDCNSNATDDATIKCDGKAISADSKLKTVAMKNNCVTLMYSVDGKTNYTLRTTGLECGERNSTLHNDIAITMFNCTSCTTNLCNNQEISLSSGVTFGLNIATLLLSTIVAFYCF